MPIIKLPDGTSNKYDTTITGNDIAASIGPGLAKAALLIEVNGKLCDLAFPINSDAKIRIITAAPLLAHAMLNISNESSVSSLFSEESLKPIYEGLYSN